MRAAVEGRTAMRVRRIAASIVGLATLATAAGAAFNDQPAPGPSSSSATAYAWAIDVERARVGLGPLTVDPVVSAQAQEWSLVMAAFSTLRENPAFGAMTAAVDPTWGGAGENVGVGGTVTSIETALMASPPHRANILGDWTHMGVGVYVASDGRVWVTERFYR
jgi:uncharacterized protein YkwD